MPKKGANIMRKNEDIALLLSALVSLDEVCPYFREKTPLPSRNDAERLISSIQSLFFPSVFSASLGVDVSEILDLLCKLKVDESTAFAFTSLFPKIKMQLLSDVSAIYEGDPAATSAEEIILAYPGFFATLVYRLAHRLYLLKLPYLPRLMSEIAHEKTGIDIHPGAEIGERFCIDHGTGVVIGETARIGDRVKIYQGVTIGAKSFDCDKDGRLIKGGKRHPDIGNDCVIYAGATILGGDTKIGNGCIIGGNVWLTHSVPDGQKVYYKEK